MSDSFLITSLVIVGLCFIALIVVGTLAIKSMGKKQEQKGNSGIQIQKSSYTPHDLEFAHNPT